MDWQIGAGLAVALAGIVLTYLKFKPESSKIFVDTARVTVEMANDARDDFRDQLADLTLRFGRLEQKFAESEAEARSARSRADRLQAQLSQEKSKVRQLEHKVGVLTQTLTDHDITSPLIPPEEEL